MALCAFFRTCDRSDVNCNCDITDNTTRKDFGYITDKDALPITGLHFSDIGEGKFGAYKVGKLKCGNSTFGKYFDS